MLVLLLGTLLVRLNYDLIFLLFGQWLWLSWQSGRFQKPRIQIENLFIYFLKKIREPSFCLLFFSNTYFTEKL